MKSILKRGIMLMVLSLCILGTQWLGAAPSGETGNNKAGFTILEDMVALLVKMPRPDMGKTEIQKAFHQLASHCDEAFSKKQIDGVFHYRFKRMLQVLTLAITDDPDAMLWPLSSQEITRYSLEKTGQKPPIRKTDQKHRAPGLGPLANSVINEVLDLHIYLETKEKRQQLMKTYMDKALAKAQPKK